MKKKIVFITLIVFSINICIAQLAFNFNDAGQSIGTKGIFHMLGDINNDGYMDLYKSAVNSEKGQIWINNGNGSFTKTQQIDYNTNNHRAAFADLNGDGFIDMFIARDASYSIPTYYAGYPNEVWLNDGTGKFTDSGQRLGKSPSNRVVLGDIDGNGTIDAVVTNYHTGDSRYNWKDYKPNEIWLNDGNGNFSLGNQSIDIGGESAQLVDIENDNDLDIIILPFGMERDSTFIFINDGTGNFTKSSQVFINLTFLKIVDINSDTYMDLIFNREVWLNNGDGTFSDNGQRIDGGIVYSGDIDTDNDIDIISKSNDSLKIWVNQGGNQSGIEGDFINTENSVPGIDISELFDFDNDSYLDAISFDWNNGDKIYINSRTTGFNKNKFLRKNEIFNIFPNPVKHTIHIKTNKLKPAIESYQLIDINGKIVKQSKILPESIDISTLNHGIYLIQVKTHKEMIYRKIIIQ